MKIIAKDDNKQLILQASEDEVARLLGEKSAWYLRNNDKRPRREKELDCGLELNITDLIDTAHELRAVPARLESIKGSLNTAINLIRAVEPVVAEIIEPPAEEAPAEEATN